MSVCTPLRPPISPSASPSFRLSAWLYVCLSACPSVRLSVSLPAGCLSEIIEASVHFAKTPALKIQNSRLQKFPQK